MKQPPQIGFSKSKIVWAQGHIYRLREVIREHLDSKPYTVTKEDDVENSIHIIRLQYTGIPTDIPLLLGDIAYALRSGLDQLAWQLALLTTDDPGRDTCFPIHDRKDTRSEERFRKIVWNIPCSAVEEIRALQPYTRGDSFRDHPLWQLNRLCNVDKHQTFAVRLIDMGAHITSPHGYMIRDLNQGRAYAFPLSDKDEIRFDPEVTGFIFGEPIDTPGIALAIRREEIEAIYEFIRTDVIPRFTRFFPEPPNS